MRVQDTPRLCTFTPYMALQMKPYADKSPMAILQAPARSA
jgi:hypothetical protein